MKTGREVWEQWDWVWHVTASGFFGLNIALRLGGGEPVRPASIFLALSALLAVWYIPFVATPMRRWWNFPGRTVLYFAVGWALWAGLLVLDAGSFLLAGMFYPLIFTRFRVRPAIAAAVCQTLGLYLFYVLLLAPEHWASALLIALGMLAAAVLIGVFIGALISQSLERRRLLEEITETRIRLLKMEREAGVLAERQRLAREIHDTLAQQFTSIVMHLAAARLGDPDSVRTRLDQAEQAAREGLDEARRLIREREPGRREPVSFVEGVEGVAARFSVENDVRVAVDVTGTPRAFAPAVDRELLRISREALHNIGKHARAHNVNITLSYMPGQFALDVADDGRGFDAAQARSGFGLRSMRERAEELGGYLTVESKPGRGTKIAVLVPIREPA